MNGEEAEKIIIYHLNTTTLIPDLNPYLEQGRTFTLADLRQYKRKLFEAVLLANNDMQSLPVRFSTWVTYYQGYCEAILMALGYILDRHDITEKWIDEAIVLKKEHVK